MNAQNFNSAPAPEWQISKLLWIGVAILIVGTGPLTAICAAASMGLTSDPNPNPVGPGLLAGLCVPVGGMMTIFGAIITCNRWLTANSTN
jgi:hypothetical protein